jgi:hypothetical protein
MFPVNLCRKGTCITRCHCDKKEGAGTHPPSYPPKLAAAGWLFAAGFVSKRRLRLFAMHVGQPIVAIRFCSLPIALLFWGKCFADLAAMQTCVHRLIVLVAPDHRYCLQRVQKGLDRIKQTVGGCLDVSANCHSPRHFY